MTIYQLGPVFLVIVAIALLWKPIKDLFKKLFKKKDNGKKQ